MEVYWTRLIRLWLFLRIFGASVHLTRDYVKVQTIADRLLDTNISRVTYFDKKSGDYTPFQSWKIDSNDHFDRLDPIWHMNEMLKQHRVVFFGDSLMREHYKGFLRILGNNIFPTADNDRYNYRMDEKEPNHENWGRQANVTWLGQIYNVDREKFAYCWNYNSKPGCGAGNDLAVCGTPQTDELGKAAFRSKSFVSTPDWDKLTVKWAMETRTRVLVVDAGRWGYNPCVNQTMVWHFCELVDTVSKFQGLVVMYVFTRAEYEKERGHSPPTNVVFFPLYDNFIYGYEQDRMGNNYRNQYFLSMRKDGLIEGHGFAGLIQWEFARLFVQLLVETFLIEK